MKKDTQAVNAFIIVIPYSQNQVTYCKEIVVSNLYFWHNNTFHHPINDETIALFLLHVKMFGATVFPENPKKGCLSINGDNNYEPGETAVSQIHYKGDVIYCRS